MVRLFRASVVFATLVFASMLLAPPASAQIITQCITNAVASGTGDAITIPTLPCANATNLLILTLSAANTTTAPTLQQPGGIALPIYNANGGALSAGSLPGAGDVVLLTGTGNSWLLLTGGSAGPLPVTVALNANASAGLTWTSLPSSATFFPGTARNIIRLDLGQFTQARIIVDVLGTACTAGTHIGLDYATTAPFTFGSYAAIGTSAVQVTCPSTSSVADSGWVNLTAGAKVANAYVAAVGSGGDGSTSPVFGGVWAEFQ